MSMNDTARMVCALRELVRARRALDHERAAFVAALPEALRRLPADTLAEVVDRHAAALAALDEVPDVADLADILNEVAA